MPLYGGREALCLLYEVSIHLDVPLPLTLYWYYALFLFNTAPLAASQPTPPSLPLLSAAAYTRHRPCVLCLSASLSLSFDWLSVVRPALCWHRPLLLHGLPHSFLSPFSHFVTMATTTTQTDRDGKPDQYTIASVATPQRTAAEAECKRVATQGMMIGSGLAVGASYLVHKLLEANCQPALTQHAATTCSTLVDDSPYSL